LHRVGNAAPSLASGIVARYRDGVARALTIDVFSYLSYRAFLRDAYHNLKAQQRGFSYRWFSKRAGLASPNFLKLVMDGKRNLSPRGAESFAVALGLAGREIAFFRELVDFEQALTTPDKNRAWERLAAHPVHRLVCARQRDYVEYLSRWWHVAIRELIGLPGFREDPEWIGRQLRPTISSAQARAAIELLLAVGAVERDGDGRLRRAEASSAVVPEVRALAEANFHREMLQRASAALEPMAPEERELTSATVTLSSRSLQLVQARLAQLRAEVLELARRDVADRVVHLHMQAFAIAALDADAPAAVARAAPQLVEDGA
jgi:uncharacterized protein (TIGR02147 family)